MLIMDINICHFNMILVMFCHCKHEGILIYSTMLLLRCDVIMDINICHFNMILVMFCHCKHEGILIYSTMLLLRGDVNYGY
jgi:hypothetical protein